MNQKSLVSNCHPFAIRLLNSSFFFTRLIGITPPSLAVLNFLYVRYRTDILRFLLCVIITPNKSVWL